MNNRPIAIETANLFASSYGRAARLLHPPQTDGEMQLRRRYAFAASWLTTVAHDLRQRTPDGDSLADATLNAAAAKPDALAGILAVRIILGHPGTGVPATGPTATPPSSGYTLRWFDGPRRTEATVPSEQDALAIATALSHTHTVHVTDNATGQVTFHSFSHSHPHAEL